MQRTRKYLSVGTLLMIAFMGITASSARVSAQSVAGSFNPQTQFQAGSRITIRSVYGIASLRLRNQTGTGQPPHWNQTQQNLPTYNASITIDTQITGDAGNGVQFTIQGGVIVINTSTIAIIGGKGEVSGIDRIMMQGSAAGADDQSFDWRMDGLAALFNGALISELTGNASITLNGAPVSLIVTYIATIS